MNRNAIPFAEFLDGDCQPQGIRADIDLVARIEERSGPAIPWDSLPHWPDADDSVQAAVQKAFPAGPREMLDLMTDGEGETTEVLFDPGCLIVRIQQGAGAIVNMYREFRFDEDLLDLVIMRLADRQQGAGKGIRILLGTLEVARRLGIGTAITEADEVGGYVWAKAGFLPEDRSWENMSDNLHEDVERKQDKDEIPDAVAEDLLEILSDPYDPAALWRFADYEYEPVRGRKLTRAMLIGYNWNGYFNIGDAKQEARLKEYAKSRGVKA